MSSHELSCEYTIIHVPAKSADWGTVLTQFTLAVAVSEGRMYASWAAERLSRATETSNGLAAIDADGRLLGLVIMEIVDQAAEMSFPWGVIKDRTLQRDLALAAMQLARDDYPDLRYLRMERQLLPGDVDTRGVEEAGFICHWRQRMELDLAAWRASTTVLPGYHLSPWHIQYLDAAAAVVFRANAGTLDAELYAPFFGDSPEECRKGLLAILVGKYGPINPRATLCAFHDADLVGINLVIDEGNNLASIVELSVDPAHQRRGVGRALLSQSLTFLKGARFERVELAVTKANSPALCMYEHLGFLPRGDFPVCIGLSKK